ncbi:SDR family NAD(P)-dependent oxidoreductase [Sphingobium yanoikuyae]|uniref:SDR family NAD(P)-dependent oxidoreductase n=4 Tax=Sphingobium yanoikuyae TaxID=13690 RepID=A0AA43BE46_SPHYA|nr:SDR family NAD(P)-dependent oxidoreductase [Sphingobium yanoikuyae]MDH2134234.1 SDR family NAD(P)-dependent oxidoreductase [Sphingobium yanoikuyae]MDH2151207.1 SDR family NAD(P)-dependent oxidoreductase [Sphingobium yanoikuyae]
MLWNGGSADHGGAEEHDAYSMLLAPVWERLQDTLPQADSKSVLLVRWENQEFLFRGGEGSYRTVSLPARSSVEEITQRLRRETIDSGLAYYSGGSGTLAFYRFVRALDEMGLADQALALRVLLDDGVEDAGVEGFAGVLAKERPHWQVHIAVSPIKRLSDFDGLIRAPAAALGEAVYWRNCAWYRRALIPVEHGLGPHLPPDDTDRVYIVIGGGGGVGTAWSKHVACRGAQLAWVGRRPLNAEIEAALAEVRFSGARALYIQADAADARALARARDEVLAHFGRIDAVVHSAMVLSDRSIGRMTLDELETVYRAKAKVCNAMREVFARDNLKFVLFFSSLQSFVKAPGQGNYAAGCTYSDAFASLLREQWNCPVKVMNWGWWGSVGAVTSPEYQERMARVEIGSLEHREAMAALDYLLTGPFEQLGILRTLRRSSTMIERAPSAINVAADESNVSWPIELGELDPWTGDAAYRDFAFHLPSLLAAQLARSPVPEIGYLQEWLEESGRYLEGRSIDRDPWPAWEASLSKWLSDPHAAPAVKLADVMLRAVPQILGGEPATATMFPEGALDLVEGVYKSSRPSAYVNEALGRLVGSVIADCGNPIRVIEIGAGTGGGTECVIEQLVSRGAPIEEYSYTDLSQAFLDHGMLRYGQESWLRVARLNIEEPVAPQGFELGRYDLVLACNVLHATVDVATAVQNAKALLRRGGLLVLNELHGRSLYSHATFGLLEGWWRCQDRALRLQGTPALSEDAWRRVLEAEGFDSIAFPFSGTQDCGQQLIVARSDGVIRQPQATAGTQESVPDCKENRKAVGKERASRSNEDLLELCIEYLRDKMSIALNISVSSLDPEEFLERYGVDSLVAVRLTNMLREDLPSVSSALIFEHRTLSGLANHILLFNRIEVESLLRVSPSIPLIPDRASESRGAGGISDEFREQAVETTRLLAVRRTNSSEEPIAVIGMSGRYPGAADLREFWANLCAGIDSVSEIPAERWDWREEMTARGEGGVYTRWGAFLEGIDCFDSRFFRISPREAEAMDPQERLFLQEVWRSIEDAGYSAGALSGKKIGVFAGVMNGRYPTGARYWSIANRVSYLLDLQGPSLAVDTACSSSLTAIHLALESLRASACDFALAGGVNLILDRSHYRDLTAASMLSATGQCRPFGAGADGFVDGEGVGVLVLKRLSDAEADRDQVLGLIRGSAISHGGRTNGYTVPNPAAQAAVIKRALLAAGVEPGRFTYIEAHGTGTSLGDPIEIEGLKHVFDPGNAEQCCAVGSVKSNIGHGESAAGVAGVTKVLLQLQNKKIVPSLNSEVCNPEIDFSRTPFFVPQEVVEWRSEGTRVAGVSSFGAGGSNAHVVIEEYIPQDEGASGISPGTPLPIILSARTPERLRARVEALAEAFGTDRYREEDFASIAYTLQVGRDAMEARLGFVASDLGEVRSILSAWLGGDEVRVLTGEVRRGSDAVELFRTDEDLRDALARWAQRGRHDRLISVWVRGGDIDWQLLWTERNPGRISLPGYPFAQERYWAEPTRQVRGRTSNDGVLHPLVHQNISNLSAQRFKSIFDGEEFFLRDHRIGDKATLPGVAYLEMFRAALGFSVSEAGAFSIQDLTWVQPFTRNGQLEVEIRVLDGGTLACEAVAVDGEERRLHAQCIAAPLSMAEISVTDMDALRSRCGRAFPVDDFYDSFARAGIVYGESFQTIKAINVGSDEVLVQLEYPTDGAQWEFHPGVLDGCFQAIASLNDGGAETFLPFVLREALAFKRLPARCWAWVRRGAGAELAFDVDVLDDEGGCSLQLRGLVLRQASFAQHANDRGGSVFDSERPPVMAISRWTPSVGECQPTHRRVLLLQSAGLPAAKQQVGRDGVHCSMVDLSSLEPAARYGVAASQLLNELKDVIGRPVHECPLLLQVVVPSTRSDGLLAGLVGMLRTARIEHDWLSVQFVEVRPGLTGAQLAVDLEIASAMTAEHVRQSLDGSWSGLRWDQADVPSSESQAPWRDGQTWLVTGGGGGIGLTVAHAIAREASRVNLILVGRRPQDREIENQLDVLRTAGAKAVWHQADIADPAAVTGVVGDAVREFGRLDGIIHCAGVLRDSFIVDKTNDELEDVFGPKVSGVINLDKSTQNIDLDWFIVFSSAAGVLGNLAQADYAAASGFLNNFAIWREKLRQDGSRRGRTVSVAWPYWRSGGMRLGSAELEVMVEGSVGSLSNEQGILALKKAAELGAPSVLVLAGDSSRLLDSVSTHRPSDGRPPSGADGASSEGDVDGRVLAAILSEMSAIQKMPISEIQAEIPWDEYGFDSISLTKFANNLNGKHGTALVPTIFYDRLTPASLAQYIAKKYPASFSPHAGVSNSNEARPTPLAIPSADARFLARPRRTGEAVEEMDSVAIIGMSGSFPMAPDIHAFWENLESGRDCISEIPADRWDWRDYWGDPSEPNRTNVRWGGFMDGVDRFDPAFFGISRREAELMDPQQRLLMMHVWNAIEDAGYAAGSLAGSQTAIFVGTAPSGYGAIAQRAHPVLEGHHSTGGVPSVGPNRISYFLDLHGPSEPIETACSSSLVAIHRGARAILLEGCEMALVGGVNTLITPEPFLIYGRSGMLSPTGRSRSFAADADGYVRGEGIGILMLKRLSSARADGDKILGIVRASAQNHGGRAKSLTAPNPRAQSDLLVQAYQRGKIAPRDISHIEAHGTGTPLGDPIEVEALKQAFDQLGDGDGEHGWCALSSVKSNIGHLELAAGVAGVMKVVLELRAGTLAPSLHVDQINPYIGLDDSPFHIVREASPWPIRYDVSGRRLPRRAGVSSFGFGGSNAHVVIEEYIPQDEGASGISPGTPLPIILSARTPERLRARVEALAEAFGTDRYREEDFASIAYTLQVGRDAMEARLGFVASDLGEVRSILSAWLGGDEVRVLTGEVRRGSDAVELFRTDEDLRDALARWAQRGRHDRLISVWVRGGDIDWQLLWTERNPGRISLPGYPFAQERYWAEPTRQASAPGKQSAHPEIDPIVPPVQEVTMHQTGDRDLLEHRVRGRAILPAAWYLSTVIQRLAATSSGDNPSYLSDVSFVSPMALGISERGQCILEIKRGEAEGNWRFHRDDPGQGSILARGAFGTGLEKPQAVDIDGLRDRISTSANVDAFYERLWLSGLEFGPSFRRVEHLLIGEGEALARLSGSERYGEEISVDDVPLIDACFQVTSALMNDAGADTYLPVHVEAMCWFPAEARSALWVHAVLRDLNGAPVSDIRLFNGAGEVFAVIDGLHFKKLEATLNKPENAEEGVSLLVPSWEEAQQQQAVSPDPGCWIIFCDNAGLGERIAKKIKSLKQSSVIVRPGEKFSLQKMGRYTIRPSEPSDFERLISEVRRSPARKLVGVLYLWSLDYDDADIWAAQEAATAGAFHLSQAIAGIAEVQKMRAVFVTSGAMKVLEADRSTPTGAPIVGLVQTVANELGTMSSAVVDLQNIGDERDEAIVTERILFGTEGPKLAIRNGRMYVFELAEKPFPDDKDSELVEDGAYLIAGGLGALGTIAAKNLLARGARQVILLGRQVVDDAEVRKRFGLESDDARLAYLDVDITDFDALNTAIKSFSSELSFAGIIHSAGSIDDDLLTNLDWKRFSDVMAPKVIGAWNLHRIAENHPVKTFVLFSSASALLGTVGQANYSAANFFMDMLAAYRHERGLPAQSIAWGPWTVGVASSLTSAAKTRMRAHGIDCIDTVQGEAILARLLVSRQRVSHVVLRRSGANDKERVHTASDSKAVPRESAERDLPAEIIWATPGENDCPKDRKMREGRGAGGVDEATQAALEAFLRDKILELLGIDESEIPDLSLPLSFWGMDSLTLIDVNRSVEKKFGIFASEAQIILDNPEFTFGDLLNHFLNRYEMAAVE